MLKDIELYKVCRIGAFITTIVVFIALFFGRTLQKKYSYLIDYIPYVELLILVATVFSVFLICRRKIKPLLLTVSLGLLGAIICESIIEFPIERIHFLKYTLLAFFLYFSAKSPTKSIWQLAVAFTSTSILGILEESAQLWVPARIFDPRDLFLNIVSALFGACFAYLFQTILSSSNGPSVPIL